MPILRKTSKNDTASEAELLEEMRGLVTEETAQLLAAGKEVLDDMMVGARWSPVCVCGVKVTPPPPPAHALFACRENGSTSSCNPAGQLCTVAWQRLCTGVDRQR